MVDLTYLEHAALTLLSILLSVAIPYAVARLSKWLHLSSTDTLRTQLDTAATNAGALVLDLLKRGALTHSSVNVDNPVVARLAGEVIAALPLVVTALGVTQNDIRALIVKKFALLNAPNPPPVTTTTTSLQDSSGNTSTSTHVQIVTPGTSATTPVTTSPSA